MGYDRERKKAQRAFLKRQKLKKKGKAALKPVPVNELVDRKGKK